MKNLLLVSIEDLNDWIEPLGGHPQAFTPNMKRLADKGVVFTRAYAAAPACSPSRTAALFSRFPWETGLYRNSDLWHDYFEPGAQQSIVGRLRDGGMITSGCGKIFHSRYRANQEKGSLDDGDWNAFFLAPKVSYPPISRSVRCGELGGNSDFGVDPTGATSYDDWNADWIVERIQPGSRGQAWVFGIYRPHLPFIAPREFFDKISRQVSMPPGLGMDLFHPDHKHVLKTLPQAARKFSRNVSRTGKVLHKHDEYEDFLRAYLAAIAYADAKLGMVLDRIEQCGLLDDTLIVLWSDHGWQLGEKLAFRKFTLWERALRVPLMFAGLGIEPARINDPVSLVDMAPTILSMLGFGAFPDFSGQDLSPVIAHTGGLARPYAASSWGLNQKDRDNFQLAYSARSVRHRLTKYADGAYELFDHANDPYEHTNLAGKQFSPLQSSISEDVRMLGRILEEIIASSAPPVENASDRRQFGDEEHETDDD